jgi:hypothetical protein
VVDTGSAEPGSEGGDPHQGSVPFSPAPGVEFSPDVDHPDLGAAPAEPPMTPGEPEQPNPISKPLFDQTGFAPGGFDSDEAAEGGFAANGRAAASSFAAREAQGGGVPGAPFSTAEVHQDVPLWSTRPNDSPDLRAGARENGWMVVTAVLVAIFVAVTVGYTVLSESGSTTLARVDEAPLTRPDAGDGTVSVPSTTELDVAPSTTEAPAPATTAPVGEWGAIIAEDRSFKAELPGTPTVLSANLGGKPAVSYTVESGSSTFRILTGSLAASTDAEIDVALEAAASSSVDGAAVDGAEVTAYPGGVRVLDFRAQQDDRTVLGRALAANGHRYVLTLTVPTAEAESPEVLADLVRFRNGFLSTP